MLPRQVISYKQLKLSKDEFKRLSTSLKLFPTPFKGIYYVPSEEERKAVVVDKPLRVISKALAIFLKSKSYFSCSTAEEFLALRWTPKNEVHVVNKKISMKIDLKSRIKRNLEKNTYRSRKVARILSFYGDKIILHKVKSIANVKIKSMPYGDFAKKSQIKIDKRRFREI
ncbi:hypothetical protein JXA56_02775 [Candidatus Micrarchaeota archaeon]|nr:hypothetical protein [Candidatus Micrarchaeota archaeon]